jgi:hypothetical protein
MPRNLTKLYVHELGFWPPSPKFTAPHVRTNIVAG